MGTDQDTPQAPVVDAASTFPRLQLPLVPSFETGPSPAEDGSVTPLRDEPTPTWTSPFVHLEGPLERYDRMVASSAEPSDDPAATPDDPHVESSHATATAYVLPELDVEPPPSPAASSRVAIGLLALSVPLLAWSSVMAFSPALLALGALVLAQIAAAGAASRTDRLPLVLAIIALAASLWAVKGGLHGFSDMAFVAGLFVLIAVVLASLVFGVAQLLLHRRRVSEGAAGSVLRSGWKLRFGALVAVLVAGVQAHRTFSAVPDAIVTFAVVALVAYVVLPVLRGTAASSDTIA